MNTEGMYVFTLYITDTQGRIYQDSVAVNVISQAALDTLLQGKWNAMVNALNGGDIPTAVAQIVSEKKQLYTSLFNALGGQLQSILSTDQSFSLITIDNGYALYELVAQENGRAYSYPVAFIRDAQGLWKIKQF
jgi:hypothetical protein